MKGKPHRAIDKALDYAAGALLGALLVGTLFILVGWLLISVLFKGAP